MGVASLAGRDHDEWKLQNQDAHVVVPLPSLEALAQAAEEAGPEAAGSLAAGRAASAPGGVLLGVFDGHGARPAAGWLESSCHL